MKFSEQEKRDYLEKHEIDSKALVDERKAIDLIESVENRLWKLEKISNGRYKCELFEDLKDKRSKSISAMGSNPCESIVNCYMKFKILG